MDRLTLEVHCPKCWNRHPNFVSGYLLRQGHNTIFVNCPHCGEKLSVTYEIRGHVRNVRAASGLPQMWTLEANK
jgi:hypothetical protein